MDSLAITEAQDNFIRLQKAIKHTANDMYVVAHLLYEAKYNKYYRDLGYGSLAEYAAQEEVGLSSSVSSKLIAIYENFCVLHEDISISGSENLFKDYTKTYTSIPLLKSNKVDDVVDMVTHNSTADIIERIRELEGIPTINGIPLNTPEGRSEELKYMTGQEWYDRFEKEIMKYPLGTYPREVLNIAKKASGIE